MSAAPASTPGRGGPPPFVVTVLLAAYRLLRRPLETRLGRRMFLLAYHLYKRSEARELAALRPFVRAGTTVIDVGANVGYFTQQFATWVAPGGRVLALEPEARNVADLRAAVGRRWPHVECLAVAASDRTGAGRLARNPFHPADHRLASGGEPVHLVTIDSLSDERGWPVVSLIKIDVQGAELAVIDGATETLRRSRPALFVEFDDVALRTQGASSAALTQRLEALAYRPHRIVPGEQPAAVDSSWVASASAGGRYVDVLWLPSAYAPHSERATGA